MRLIDDGIVKVNNYLRCGKKSHKNILVNIQMQKQKITAHTPIKLPHGETGYIQKHKDTLAKQDRNKDNIYLVLQFFIHPDEKRNKELLYCLKQNVRLGLFNKIYLLNERIYTAEEMGLTPEEEKIILPAPIPTTSNMSLVAMNFVVCPRNFVKVCLISNFYLAFRNFMSFFFRAQEFLS